MNLEAFVRARQPEWTELDDLVRRAGGRPERLGPDGVRRLGALYRAGVADLARARRAFGADPAVRVLEEVVSGARVTLYAVPKRRGSVREYLMGGYWRAVRERGRIVALAWLLLIGSTALATVWAHHDPASAASVVPASLIGSGGPRHAIGLAAGQAAEFSVSIFINNIGVTFVAFASGIVFGILPAFVLVYNGLILGAVAGVVAGTGHAPDVVELLAPHGVLELSCIVVSSAAGIRMGWALVEPGRLTRPAALAAAARPAIGLVLGTMPWLVAAGLTEGFVTPHHLPLAAALAVGLGLAAPYWIAVARLGR